jgi:predicted RNase H-like nuclease (RuvC/YqgF family)
VIVGIDSLGHRKFALVAIEGEEELKTIVSKNKLFRAIRELKPEIVAIDSISELFKSKEEIIEFLKNTNTRLVQVAVDSSLPTLARRFGIKMNPRDPFDEARTCAYLASFDIGYEVSVFTDKTQIVVSRNRSLGKGGWRQKRYSRKVHDAVRSVYREIKAILDDLGLEYSENVRNRFGGISRGEIIINAPRKDVPISNFKTKDVQVKVSSVEKEKVELIPLSRAKRYLIAGIDPGTTTAVAIMDLAGNLISIRSKKDWSLSEVIEYITEHGKPVIIATDKKNPPELVSKLKATFNAVLYSPKEDLNVEKKRDLTCEFKILNDHERDALAAAMDAFNYYKSKFRNIERRIPAGVDSEKVKAEIVRGTKLDSLFEDRKVERNEKKEFVDADLISELERRDKKIKELLEENDVLRRQIRELKEEIDRLRTKIANLSSEEKERIRKETYIRNLEFRISELLSEIRDKDSEISRLKEQIEMLRKFKIGELMGWKEVKILRKFSKEEIEQKKDIDEGDIVLILDSSGGSDSVAEMLCERKIKAVITFGEMSHLAKEVFDSYGIPRIAADEVEVVGGEGFAFVSPKIEEVYRKKLEELRRKRIESIEKLFEDYRRMRRL